MHVFQAIETHVLPATNTKGRRIKATAGGGASVTISEPIELDGAAAHHFAAKKLAEKLGWSGRLIGGGLKNSYVWVFDAQKDNFVQRRSIPGDF